MFCGSIAPKIPVRYVYELLQDVQEVGTMFFISVSKCYSTPPVVVKAVTVSLLDRLMFLHLLETIVGLFLLNDVDGMDWSA